MTEPVDNVRARLAEVKALCEASIEWSKEGYSRVGAGVWADWWSSPAGAKPPWLFIAATSPDQMLRLVTHAEEVLDRHILGVDKYCDECGFVWPCLEVAGILKAWTL